MDYELGERSTALIGETSMPDDKLLDVAELGHGKIGSERSLHTFFAHDTKTDIGFLDHGDIITTVTNACDNLASALLDLDCNDSFLRWTASADADSFCRLGHIEEFLAKLLIGDNDAQCSAIDHQHVRRSQILIIINFFIDSINLCLIRNDLDILVAILQASRNCNALSSLNFVTSEHPYLNSCLSQCIDSFKHILLQLIFNTCDGKEIHLVLKRHDCLCDLLVSVNH